MQRGLARGHQPGGVAVSPITRGSSSRAEDGGEQVAPQLEQVVALVQDQGPRPAAACRPTRARPDGVTEAQQLGLLHPNGRALIDRLAVGGPLTVVLDECHHLLELWGHLLTRRPRPSWTPRIIGLTATPPVLMTAGQAELHQALFGAVDLEVSAPALVRSGTLPRIRSWPTWPGRPRPRRSTFTARRSGLPSFAPTCWTRSSPAPRSGWLQARVVDRPGPAGGAQVSWQRFEHDEPALATPPSGCTWPGCCRCPTARGSASSTAAGPTPTTGSPLIGDYCRTACWPATNRATSRPTRRSAGRSRRSATG